MTRLAPLLLAFALPLAACGGGSAPEAGPEAAPTQEAFAAPSWEMDGPGGAFSLADAEGRAVVLQFAAAAPEAWGPLAEAHADLDAAGALVVGAVTEGAPGALRLPFATVADADGAVAASYGYTGAPLVVVIDAEGRLRARAEMVETTDGFFALAAGALLDAEDEGTPLAPTSETREPQPLAPEAVAGMVREGAALLDLRPEAQREADGAIPHALVPEAFSAEVLPVNALVPVILAGPDALEAAFAAVDWGFQSVYVVEDAAPLADPEAAPLAPEADATEDARPGDGSRLPGRRRAIG